MTAEPASVEQIGAATYTVPLNRYAAIEAQGLMRRWWWAVALPPLGLLIAGAYDERYLYVCLMTVLIVYPMLLSLAWLAICARPAMAWCTRPQSFDELPDGGRSVHFYAFPAADGTPGEKLATIEVSAGAIDEARIVGKYLLVSLPADNALSIPILLIPNKNEQTGPENDK